MLNWFVAVCSLFPHIISYWQYLFSVQNKASLQANHTRIRHGLYTPRASIWHSAPSSQKKQKQRNSSCVFFLNLFDLDVHAHKSSPCLHNGTLTRQARPASWSYLGSWFICSVKYRIYIIQPVGPSWSIFGFQVPEVHPASKSIKSYLTSSNVCLSHLWTSCIPDPHKFRNQFNPAKG